MAQISKKPIDFDATTNRLTKVEQQLKQFNTALAITGIALIAAVISLILIVLQMVMESNRFKASTYQSLVDEVRDQNIILQRLDDVEIKKEPIQVNP